MIIRIKKVPDIPLLREVFAEKKELIDSLKGLVVQAWRDEWNKGMDENPFNQTNLSKSLAGDKPYFSISIINIMGAAREALGTEGLFKFLDDFFIHRDKPWFVLAPEEVEVIEV